MDYLPQQLLEDDRHDLHQKLSYNVTATLVLHAQRLSSTARAADLTLSLQRSRYLDVFDPQTLGINRILEKNQCLLQRQRFLEEVVCPQLGSAYRGFYRAMTRNHDDLRRAVGLANLLKCLQPVNTGQPDIQKDNVKAMFS